MHVPTSYCHTHLSHPSRYHVAVVQAQRAIVQFSKQNPYEALDAEEGGPLHIVTQLLQSHLGSITDAINLVEPSYPRKAAVSGTSALTL